METSPQRSNTKQQPFTSHDNTQETRSSRRSLDFSSNAEKPFVDNPQTQRKSPSKVSVEAGGELDETRKVHFATNASELQKAETNIAENTLVAEDAADQNRRSPSSHEDRHTKPTGSAGLSPKVEGETEELRRGHSKPESPQRYSDHLRILAYLVGELRAILASSGKI